MNTSFKKASLVIVLVLVTGSILYLESQKVRPKTIQETVQCIPGPNGSCATTEEAATVENRESVTVQVPKTSQAPADLIMKKEKEYDRYAEIVLPSGYINTDGKPLSIGELVGKKVILVDFWTYSCINCQRTLPYLTSWYAKYKNAGLEIVSIHTPEFAFEKVRENVEKAAQGFGVTYPIVQDNDYGTWRAYRNNYWPRKYLIDIDGFVVYDHIGEGAYDVTENKILELLAERAERLGGNAPTASVGGVEAETVDATKPRTPEIYFGAWRNELLGNGTKYKEGEQSLTIPLFKYSNVFYLGGTWNIAREFVINTTGGARITLPYQAQKVFMVARADSPVRAKILIDGAIIPLSMRGADIDENGYVTFQEDRLYRLVESETWGQHTIEIFIETPGLEAYTFTFG